MHLSTKLKTIYRMNEHDIKYVETITFSGIEGKYFL